MRTYVHTVEYNAYNTMCHISITCYVDWHATGGQGRVGWGGVAVSVAATGVTP